jgi:superoxide reductase
MKRRDFLKGALLATTLLASGKSFAKEYKKADEKELLRVKNRDNPSILEQKHVPGIVSPAEVSKDEWFDVKVKVGFEKEHPSTPEHWITMIKLLANGNPITKTKFKVGGVSPSSTLFRIRLKKSSTIEVIENCNLHGTWISDPVKIKVL